MSIISINRSDLEREYWSQIWGYIQPHQTICYDPNPPLYFPPSAQVTHIERVLNPYFLIYFH
jgi:hypothetical protein